MPPAKHPMNLICGARRVSLHGRQQTDALFVGHLCEASRHEVVWVHCAHPMRREVIEGKVINVGRDQIPGSRDY